MGGTAKNVSLSFDMPRSKIKTAKKQLVTIQDLAQH